MKEMLFITSEQACGVISEDTAEAFGTCFNTPFVSLLVTRGLVPKIDTQAQC